MKRVYLAAGAADAELIRGLLASYGLDAVVTGQYAQHGAGLSPPFNPGATVWVTRDEDDAEAKALIKKHHVDPQPDRPAWRCRVCGEDNEGGFLHCWKCSTEL